MDFKLAFFDVCDLSAARYSAANGVDYVHFNFYKSHDNPIKEEEFSEIYPLISGPEILISYSKSQNLKYDKMGINSALLHPIYEYKYSDRYKGNYSLFIEKEEGNIKGNYQNIFARNLEIYVWLMEEGYENVFMPVLQFDKAQKGLIDYYKPHGIYIKLPKEIEVGMADYSEISDFLEMFE